MPSSADAAGSWRLGHRAVNRMGLDTMRLTGTRPFHGGVPRDRDGSTAVLRRAVELGVDHGATAARVRPAWTLALGRHVLVIPGTGSLEHLEKNIGAARLRLDDQQMARLAS